jgi:PAS domain S-box-containing protein
LVAVHYGSLVEAEKIVAVAGVGNKASDYDKSDERQMVLLLKGMWSYIQKTETEKRIQAELRERKLSEEKLREASLYARSLLEASPDPLVTINTEGKITDVNEATELVTGVRREQLIGSDFSDYFTSPEEARKGYQKVFTDGFVKDYPLAIRSKSGRTTDVLYNATLYKNETGEIQGIFAAARDVTDRKKAEAAVQAERKRLFDVLETLPTMVCLLTPDYHVAFANRSFREKFGESDGRPCYEYCFGQAEPCEFCESFNVLKTGKPHNWEATTPEGSAIDVYDYPFTDVDGSPMILEMDIDITKRKHAEAELKKYREHLEELVKERTNALRESEQRWSTTLASIGDAVIATDLDGKITFMNAVAEELTGWTIKEASKKPIETVFNIINEQTRLQVENPVAKVLKKGVIVGLANHTILVRKNGTEVAIDDSGAPIRDENGEVMGVVLVFRDITERRKNEQALINAKTEWERTFDSVPDLIAILDSQHRIVRANRAMAERLGTTPECCIGLSCYKCVHGTSVPPEFCPHVQTLQDGKEHVAEVHENRLGGDFVVSTTPLMGEKGQMIGSVHVARDITERKRTENTLRETRDYLENLLNYANAPIIVWDPEFRITRFNHAFERLTGISSNDAVGKNLDILFPLDKKEESMAHIKQTLEGEHMETVEIPILHVDGMVKTLLWNSANIYDSDGKQIVATIAQGHDITERKKAQEDLLKSEEQERARAEELKTILNAVPAAVWIANDPESRQIAGNRPSYELLRLPEGANASMSAPEGERPINYRVLKDGRELKPDEMPVQLAAKGEVLRDYEFAVEFTDGITRYLLGNACPLYDKEGKQRGSVAAFIDITERKAMQDKLEDYRKHLEKLVEEKTRQLRDAERLSAIGETAGMVGHDIRNPLQAIIGELYLAKDELASLTDGEAKDNLNDTVKEIEEQVTYINKIVTDLQDYARPLAPCFEETDLENTIQSVLSATPVLENIKVTYSVSGGFPKLILDPSYIRRILTNLISNAVQAMPDGGTLTIRARCKDKKALISVADTGEGIPEEAKSRIFKPLFTTKAKGQGFGLAVVKKLTDALSGTITFESEKGEGTTFTITLPLQA